MSITTSTPFTGGLPPFLGFVPPSASASASASASGSGTKRKASDVASKLEQDLYGAEKGRNKNHVGPQQNPPNNVNPSSALDTAGHLSYVWAKLAEHSQANGILIGRINDIHFGPIAALWDNFNKQANALAAANKEIEALKQDQPKTRERDDLVNANITGMSRDLAGIQNYLPGLDTFNKLVLVRLAQLEQASETAKADRATLQARVTELEGTAAKTNATLQALQEKVTKLEKAAIPHALSKILGDDESPILPPIFPDVTNQT